MQRSRNGGCGQDQHVGQRAEFKKPLLVLNAKPLFFVNDDKPQVRKSHILGKQPVGSNQDINFTFGGGLQHRLGLLPGPQAAQTFNAEGESGKTLAE